MFTWKGWTARELSENVSRKWEGRTLVEVKNGEFEKAQVEKLQELCRGMEVKHFPTF